MSASPTVLALAHMRSRIIAQVAALVASCKFYRLEIDPQTGAVLTTKTAPFEVVPSAICDVTGGTFGPSRKKTADRSDPLEFGLTLELDFPQQANALTDEFDDLLCRRDDTRIPASAAYPRQIDFRLRSATYTHPTRHNSVNGTRARYTIAVELGSS